MVITQTPTTELDAVNALLATTGEAPVNVLTGSGIVTADIARSILHETNRAYQAEGWYFNTEISYQLTPDVSGYLNVPTNVLRLETDIASKDMDVVQRGARIYNRTTRSYVFNATVAFDMVVFLTYEELPEASRQYVMMSAARLFQDRVLGADALHAFNEQDLSTARAHVEKEEIENSQSSLLDASRAFQGLGWWFNTELDYTLTPDGSGFLNVPAKTLRVETTRAYKDTAIALRGAKLWNVTTHSYVFSAPIKVHLVTELALSLLPDNVKNYLQIVANRNLQAMQVSQSQGGPKQLEYRYGNLRALTEQDEKNARMAIERDEVRLSQLALSDASYAVQSQGWWFNIDQELQLSPDGGGFIQVPSNTIRCVVSRNECDPGIILRGAKLYDTVKHTAVFTRPVVCHITTLLLYSDLPDVAQRYIRILAGRAVQFNKNLPVQLPGYTDEDEHNARIEMERAEIENRNYNMMTDSYSVSETIYRMM